METRDWIASSLSPASNQLLGARAPHLLETITSRGGEQQGLPSLITFFVSRGGGGVEKSGRLE